MSLSLRMDYRREGKKLVCHLYFKEIRERERSKKQRTKLYKTLRSWNIMYIETLLECYMELGKISYISVFWKVSKSFSLYVQNLWTYSLNIHNWVFYFFILFLFSHGYLYFYTCLLIFFTKLVYDNVPRYDPCV